MSIAVAQQKPICQIGSSLNLDAKLIKLHAKNGGRSDMGEQPAWDRRSNGRALVAGRNERGKGKSDSLLKEERIVTTTWPRDRSE